MAAPTTTFARWSPSHWGAIVATLIAAAALSSLRRRVRDDTRAARRLDLGFAAVAAVIWVATQVLQACLDEFPMTTALPLHVSDLTGLAIPIALARGDRWSRAIVYYWGLVLATPLAFLIPDLRAGPARLGYWLFWLPHLLIVTAAVYDLFGRGYRPAWPDLRRAAAASIVYALLMVPFDAATGFSYGYLGPAHPGEPAALKLFGPWPWRTIAIVATGIAAMALLTLPWQTKRTRPLA
jgi:hypothetical integral membrane protein (TIGR02206 family)